MGMFETSLNFIKCPNCGGKLNLEIYKSMKEISEGILKCKKCQLDFPIIDKIPIMLIDFDKYISEHRILSGKLYKLASTKKMKEKLKLTFNRISWKNTDKSEVEERWAGIYRNNKNDKFYKKIKTYLKLIPKGKIVLEYGCSIGIISNYISNFNEIVFGIDKSFIAIQIAKKNQKSNVEFILSDFTSASFGNRKFDRIIGLNILELIEPNILLKIMNSQVSKGYIIISDPYDYQRGIYSVKHPLNELQIRKKLTELGFKINTETEKPSFIPWELKLNNRANLNYKVDVIIAKK